MSDSPCRFQTGIRARKSDDGMRILLADEISPDSCRLWDVVSNEKMDKDRFRQNLGGW